MPVWCGASKRIEATLRAEDGIGLLLVTLKQVVMVCPRLVFNAHVGGVVEANANAEVVPDSFLADAVFVGRTALI